ncbi:MAG: DUF3604 domain-containing protein [Nitrospirae bacterium]|nr:DUF3604 domain-containing protein [Nitrospirota bacterium]
MSVFGASHSGTRAVCPPKSVRRGGRDRREARDYLRRSLTAFCLVLSWTACDTSPASHRARILGPEGKQILFGDLHAHTTYSYDAYLFSLSALQGYGVSPPSAACDFARYCSQLDFWSINDHAEDLRTEYWTDTREAIRACNDAAGGDSEDPDMVSYLGWEWTQDSKEIKTDYGHKNVILLDTEEGRVPTRPIAAASTAGIEEIREMTESGALEAAVKLLGSLDSDHTSEYAGLLDRARGMFAVPRCAEGVDTRRLPTDCREYAADPATLFEKLDQWGFDSLVIPHGNAWGAYHPWLSNWDKQLDPRQHDPSRQRLIEVFSGHGNSESYRPWTASEGEGDDRVCPAPRPEYLPCCWRAGEIVRSRTAACAVEPDGAECTAAVRKAQHDYLAGGGGSRGRDAFPDVPTAEWLDCGQCRDCFAPAFNLTPGTSVQAALARSKPVTGADPLRLRFGLIGSTDGHRAWPGVGYREDKRFTDSIGIASPKLSALKGMLDALFSEWERQYSFYFTGGLVAVHADGRGRRAIWEALKRREVYATSGERILLWFHMVDGSTGRKSPMGSEVSTASTPAFEVTAVGALKQSPGCPAEAVRDAPPGFVATKCFGECYNPIDQRYAISRIEVIRITPQVVEGESLKDLMQDPWKVIPCPGSPEGCTASFEDSEFAGSRRSTVYYVRAIQEATPQVNGAGLRCEPDATGHCTSTRPCYWGYRGEGDDCLASAEERAWSSPIFVEPE